MRRVDRDDLLNSDPVPSQILDEPFAFGLTPLSSPVMDETRRVPREDSLRLACATRRHVGALDKFVGMRAEQGRDEVQSELADFKEVVAVVRTRDIVVGGVA